MGGDERNWNLRIKTRELKGNGDKSQTAGLKVEEADELFGGK